MTKLQELILKRQEMADKQKAAFDAHKDVSEIPEAQLAEIKTRNEEIATLDSEIKRLTDLEEMKKGASVQMVHSIGDTRPVEGTKSVKIDFPRVSSIKNFHGERAGRKADERAYRFAKWFTGAVLGVESAKQYCKDNGIQIKAHSEGTNYQGGYLVPDEFSNDIIDLREQYGVARRVSRVVPMGSDTLSIPRRAGGLTAYFVGEATAITESTKSWDQVNLVARKLGVLSLWSSELNEDAMVNIGDDLAGEIAYAFSNKEDDCFFNGDGTSTYGTINGVRNRLLDVFTSSGGTGLIVGAGNAYSELTLANFHSVIGALPLYARGGAQWVVSATFYDTVMHSLQTAAGGNTVADIANGGQQRFLGYPVTLSQVMPSTTANSQVAALLGNFRLGSTFGDRRMLTLALSSDYKFAEDQLAIRGTERFDINIHDVGATGVAGPIVGLIMASS
jgi:HK97 family phage major capsid protein